ncbi:hypothetical protein AB6A40_004655 [Gnathostoma spinigerum]|uniref:Ribosome biogenesis protein WDR12 homolog n=1 Tax=Gnathostoma spinigerum TaxID=75299 RepID=A0ABD6EE69_9BILA
MSKKGNSDMKAAMSPMDESAGIPHYQIALFSENTVCRLLPRTTISVPSNVTPEKLSALANTSMQGVDSNWRPTEFDFLIGTSLLRGPLDDFVDEHLISIENVIEIECIVREPAPQPDLDLPHSDWLAAIKASSQHIFSTTFDGSLTVWTHEGEKVKSLSLSETAAKCLDFISPLTDFRIAVGFQDQSILVASVIINDEVLIEVDEVLRGHERSVECVASNATGDRLVSGGFDYLLKVWNCSRDDDSTKFKKFDDAEAKRRKTATSTKTPMVTLSGHRDAIIGAAWLPDSEKEVCTASWDHTLRIWDLELAGEKNSLSSTKSFTSLSICPTSCLILTGSVDPVVRLFDPRSHDGSLVKQSFIGHSGWVSCVRWSPKRENLFISGSYDQVLKMWDVRSGKTPLYDMKGHTDRILCCDWSCEELILSGGVDCTLKSFRRKA